MTITLNGTGTGTFTDASGNVGIGTTTPSQKLTVVDATSANMLLSGSTTNFITYAYSGFAVSGTTSNTPWLFYTNNTERMRIDSSGVIQVGGTTVGNTAGYVNSRTNARAWCNFDGTLTGTITPRANYNVSSVTKNGTGDYTVNFTTSLADANYVWSGSCPPNGAETVGGTVRGYSAATQLAGSCRIRTLGQTTTLYDTTIVNFMAFGN